MPSELRLLLDEHYPHWLAVQLTEAGVDTVAVTGDRVDLRGAADATVLRVASVEGRVVVTEDVTTFGVAVVAVPDHLGVVYCHHRRFPRTRPGLDRLRRALLELAADPPGGLGRQPAVWWLDGPTG